MATQIKNLNIKLSEKLMKEVKEVLGVGEDISKLLRKQLQELIEKRKNIKSPYHYCFCCDKSYSSSDDMNCIGMGEYDNEYHFVAYVCNTCFKEVIDTPLDKYKELMKSSKDDVDNPKFYPTGRKSWVCYVLCWDKEHQEAKECHKHKGIEDVRLRKEYIPNYELYDQKLIDIYPTIYKVLPGRFLSKKDNKDYAKQIEKIVGMYDNKR